MRRAGVGSVAAVILAAAACSSTAAPPKIPDTPVPAPWSQPQANPSFTSHMLTATDFGAGWYEDFTPTVPTLPTLPAGARAGAMTMLSKAHQIAGGSWDSDVQITEDAVDFDSATQARRYVHLAVSHTDPVTGVVSSGARPGSAGGFVIGNRAYILNANFFTHPAPGHSTAVTNVRGASRIYALAKRLAARPG